MASRTVTRIDKNWVFKQAGIENSKFLPVAQFPTNVHLDLLHNGLISDPFVGKNEDDVQWIGEARWVYKTTFAAGAIAKGCKAVLAFDGLDTFATVTLNETQILQSDNMFTSDRVDVTEILKDDNELVIEFDSAYLRGWKLVEEYPDHKWGVWNGDNSRLAVRKAQYHWGWDWGPTLNTCGPWRPITLEVYEARISDVYFDTTVAESLESAHVTVHAVVQGHAEKMRLEIFLDGNSVATETTPCSAGRVDVSFHISKPSLWYPIRHGKQPLYDVTATLVSGETDVDVVSKKMGIRKVELVQRPVKDQPGTSFFFQVNNVPIFCGGSDWIPADSFLPRITRQRYRDWVQLVADGNQCMIRVWGGGIYEEQHFYDACDELGILVWQDFMFACGNYPTFPAMLESIEREAIENVKRLRHHPCMVIWAGNNEDYQYQESSGLTYDYANKDAESWLKTDFPARYIYEKVLADVCNEHVPGTYYHFGSPWGGGRHTSDPTVGDLHQWNVWHGSQEKYQSFGALVGRFVSEFGMQAFPSVKTIEAWLPGGREDVDAYAQSATVDFHNKASGHERRLALYLAENIRYAPSPLESYIYATQLVQAECLSTAYRLWRRQWKGEGREYCGGALVWQINDCWPATSWSMVDYYLRPKPAYFAVRRELAPLTVGIERRVHRRPQDRYTRARIDVVTRVDVWASNLGLHDVVVDCMLRAWDVETGALVSEEMLDQGAVLPSNRSTELAERDVPVRTAGDESRTVVAAYLFLGGEQVARHINWPEPLKYLHLPKPKDLMVRLVCGATAVQVSAEVPVKGVALECEDDGVRFEDNLVDLVPGEVVTVGVRGATEGTKIETRYLGMLD